MRANRRTASGVWRTALSANIHPVWCGVVHFVKGVRGVALGGVDYRHEGMQDEEALLRALADGLAEAVHTPAEAAPTYHNLGQLYGTLCALLASSMVAVAVTWYRYGADVCAVIRAGRSSPSRLASPRIAPRTGADASGAGRRAT